jgi:hypothetical protein
MWILLGRWVVALGFERTAAARPDPRLCDPDVCAFERKRGAVEKNHTERRRPRAGLAPMGATPYGAQTGNQALRH